MYTNEFLLQHTAERKLEVARREQEKTMVSLFAQIYDDSMRRLLLMITSSMIASQNTTSQNPAAEPPKKAEEQSTMTAEAKNSVFDDPIMTREEVADYLKVGITTLKKLDIPWLPLMSYKRAKKSDIDLWLKSKLKIKEVL